MPVVPGSTHDITASWLTEILIKTGRLKGVVTDLKLETIAQGVGLMGELGRLHLTYEGETDLPATMIAKCAAQNENRQVARLLDFYNREVNFYNLIAPDCPLRIPGSYYADVNQESYDFVLLMQDLGDVSPRDQLTGAAEQEVVSAITEIARLHAKWWGASEAGHGWMYDGMSVQEALRLKSLVYQPAMEPALEKFDHLLNNRARAIIRTVGERYEEFWALHMLPVDTFVHGDYRQDNMLYTSDQTDALVMDWQISGRGKPVFDVAYFMCQSVPSTMRLAMERDILELYLGRLKDAGIDYPFGQCLEDYRRIVLGCLVYPITVCGSLDLANDRGKALAECMLTRNLAAIDDLGADALL